MSRLAAWFVLLALGIILIDVGITGRPGSLLGAVITPSQLRDSGGSNG